MTKQEICLEAARRAAECEDRIRRPPWQHTVQLRGACEFLDVAEGTLRAIYFGPTTRAFRHLFRPSDDERVESAFDSLYWLEMHDEPPRASRHRRVVALCLAAAMAATGDL